MGAVQAPSCGLAKASSPVSKVLESDGGKEEVMLYSLILTSLDSLAIPTGVSRVALAGRREQMGFTACILIACYVFTEKLIVYCYFTL